LEREQPGVLLRDNVYDLLRGAILTCELRPGQDLREQELAAHYAVSRSPVRDALLRLEAERLVTVLPRQGYRVNAVSVANARDILDLRLLIEPACAAAAAEAAGRCALAGFLNRYCKEIEFVAYNRAFHAAIGALSGNVRMAAVARDLVEQSDRLVRVSLRAIGERDRGRLVAEHDAIIGAIVAGDGAKAARIARQHVADARGRILMALEIAETEGIQT
jgi:GntR family transcriptional regulator, rspAB operon transcriptional repressor